MFTNQCLQTRRHRIRNNLELERRTVMGKSQI